MLLQLFVTLSVLAPLQNDDVVTKYRTAAIDRWESTIQSLEKRDKEEVDPAQAVLFLGSSSIRRWKSIAEDMAPYPVIERGYGGAKYSDLAVFAQRLLKPHNFAAVAIFVGNDISGSKDDKSPEETLQLVKAVVKQVHDKKADSPVFLIAVTPTSSRFHVWNQIQKLNALMSEYCAADERLHFIATAEKFLDADGRPIDGYFVEDKLHLNQKGYQVWSAIIKGEFEKTLKISK